MKVKSILAGILSTVMCLSVLTACGQPEENKSEGNSTSAEQSSQSNESTDKSTNENSTSEGSTDTSDGSSDTPETKSLTLTIRDAGKSPAMTAVFYNTQNGSTKEVEMTKTGEDDTCFVYTCEGDPSAYNMFHLIYGENSTNDVSFNSFIEAWYLCERELLPCRTDKDYDEKPEYQTVNLTFHGYDKNVHIWTPEDYDASSDVKYSVIYMLDGQTVIDAELDPGNNRSWSVAQHVTSMMDVTDYKAILVCIETMGAPDESFSREDELVPDFGFSDEIKEKSGCSFLGAEFGDYLSKTVVPYVEEHYNVYQDAAHRGLCGSSLGGLASFYIGFQHPETFGTIGAFSSTFNVGTNEQWAEYLMPIIQAGNVPFVFMYDGSYYSDNGALSEMMNNALIENGFPKDKIVFCKYEPAEHNVPSWSAVYPQFLEAMFTQQLAAVKSGEPVEYLDKSKQHPALDPNMTAPDTEIENDTRPDHIKNYLFFDNSETKWEHVYAYFWGGVPVNKVTGETFDMKYAAWPGYEMERIEGTDIYRMPMPVGVTNIVFSTGVSDEDVANGVEAYQTGNLAISNVNNSGKVYKIDTSVEARRGSGRYEKTKYRYMEGEWVDYTE